MLCDLFAEEGKERGQVAAKVVGKIFPPSGWSNFGVRPGGRKEKEGKEGGDTVTERGGGLVGEAQSRAKRIDGGFAGMAYFVTVSTG